VCQDDHEEDKGQHHHREEGIVDAQEHQGLTVQNLMQERKHHTDII
jgi:hypothetical protein